MLQKKIYRSICLLSILTLTLIMLFVMPACYSLLCNQLKEDVSFEGKIIAVALPSCDDYSALLEKFSAGGRHIKLVSDDGNILFENETKKSNTDDFIYETEIEGVGTLTVCAASDAMFKIFGILLFPALFFALLIFLLVHLIASKLSESIVLPITDINFNTPQENIYGELKPFVSKIKSQNSEIKKQIKKLKAQKSRLGTISENMNEGLIVFDKNGTILSINQSALKIFSISDEKAISEIEIDSLSKDSEFTESVKEARSGKKRFFEYHREDSTYQVFCSPVYEKEKVGGVVMLIFDISEKQQAEKIRREFSANVSHELKTPLTTVLGYSELIAGGIAKDEDIKGFAEKIAHESSRLIGLIEDIIKLSKLDEQGIVDETEPVNLYETAAEVIRELMPHADKNNISVSLSGNTSFINGNPSQLYELVFNLCDNAIKYNKPRGSVNVTVKENMLSVEDTGIGISKKDTGRIFERFFRVDKSHSKAVNGTGLGLSIVKHIALSHNAQIDVESEPGAGTKITVRFQGGKS